MEILLSCLLLVVGFAALIKGADLFVDGSSGLAANFRVPAVIIGLTVVAMGTSAPELAVSTSAAVAGSNEIALSNVVGSNLFNLLMVIGVCALFKAVPTPKEMLKRDMWWNIAVTAVLLVMIFNFGSGKNGYIRRFEGILLLLGIISYIVIVVRSALKNRETADDVKILPVWLSIIYIIGGVAAIIFGGDLVVDNASKIAEQLGMSKTLVGLTIVAIGTSLPELVTSVVAAKKGNAGIAMGNAIGSSIFNILFILGIASTLSPIKVDPDLLVDTIVLLAVTVMTLIFSKTKNEVNRWEGTVMVLCYCAYTAYIIYRCYA